MNANDTNSNSAPKKKAKLPIILAFAFIGVVGTSALGPSALSWWISPPTSFGVDCGPSAHWATMMLLKFQMAGSVLGAMFGTWFVLRK